MRRSSALAAVLGVFPVALAATASRGVAGDLPTPAHRTVASGAPARPGPREPPTPWLPAEPEPRPLEVGAVASPPAPKVAPEPADDQGVPRIAAPARPSADAFDPSIWDPKVPPLGQPMGGRDRISLRTDPLAFGNFETFDVGGGVVAYVMVGNPVVEGIDFLVKAERIVAWLDAKKAGPGFGLGLGAPASPETGAKPPPTGATASSKDKSVLPEALIAIYAVGAVDLVSGSVAFRASELYLNARTNRALLVEPRFDTLVPLSSKPGAKAVPLHVRAQTLRTLESGYAVFEKGDVSSSRSVDRLGIEVAVLTMEQLADLEAGKPTLLGFHTAGSQRFSGRSIVGRAERLPLVYVSKASFGEISEFPVRPHATTGSRSSLGRYAIVGAGRRTKLGDDAYVDWLANVGGYTKRGLAAGGDLDWRSPASAAKPPRLSGAFSFFAVDDHSGKDRTGYVADEGVRWKAELENRYEITPSLRLDAELNAFSDRGFNPEFFEADARTHKDRETYARLRWLEGGSAATFTMGAHLRDFATETLEQPGVALWSESVPLGETSGPVRLAFDLSSAASVSRIARRFDSALPDSGYEALRADVTERVYAPFDAGDVRISPFVGVRWTGYFDRSDGGDDVSRTALEAGVRANLELHRDFALVGGAWRLDGLRHVLDVDVGGYARAFDPSDPADVPSFDRVEPDENRTEIFVEVRNRLETRRDEAGERRNATLADLRLRASFWPEDVGPYGRRGPGEVYMWGMAEISPDRAWLRGESIVGLEGTTFRHSSIGVQWSPRDEVSAAVGVRHVQNEVLAPWFEVFGRWNEKWGARFNGIRDFDSGVRGAYRLSILRFSDDHVLELGVTFNDRNADHGVFLNFQPSIGGEPLTSPFDPRDTIDYTP